MEAQPGTNGFGPMDARREFRVQVLVKIRKFEWKIETIRNCFSKKGKTPDFVVRSLKDVAI